MMNTIKLPHTWAIQHQVVLLENMRVYSPMEYRPEILHQITRYIGSIAGPWVQCDKETFEKLMLTSYGANALPEKASLLTLTQQENLQTLFQHDQAEQGEQTVNHDAPVIKLINTMLDEALLSGASDIHIESYKNCLIIRFRIDGILRIISQSNERLASPVISRLKIMASLDIAEKRIPQDGRIVIETDRYSVDIRVSVVPVAFGERVVLRLLDKKTVNIDINNIGIPPSLLSKIQALIAKPHGMLLVTGPTGSGKSTSLYAFLKQINSPQRNLLTIEDPIEYMIPGVGQMQVNNKAGMSFAKGLRAILRQDPDVVMIGEIRDTETASIAIQASLTGHMVFSTLHTNTAVGAISRLRDMGVETYLLSSALTAIVSQRLLRVLCPACKQMVYATEKQQALLGITTPEALFIPVGCDECNHSGYKGRTGIYELIVVDEHIRALIHKGAMEEEMAKYLAPANQSLQQQGYRTVLAGVSSLEELLRVTDSSV